MFVGIFPSIFYFGEIIESTTNTTNDVDWFTCLYFSIITATTLGYGDYHPFDWGIYIAIFEVLCGLVFLGFFIQMLIRKIR
jgi:hypothetical protein